MGALFQNSLIKAADGGARAPSSLWYSYAHDIYRYIPSRYAPVYNLYFDRHTFKGKFSKLSRAFFFWHITSVRRALAIAFTSTANLSIASYSQGPMVCPRIPPETFSVYDLPFSRYRRANDVPNFGSSAQVRYISAALTATPSDRQNDILTSYLSDW